MKRTIKIFSFLLVMMMLFTNVAFAADASITYEGGAEKYVFLPGSEYSETDLFDNFKGVMPGDELEQKITVKNEQGDCDFVKIYMRAVPHDDAANPIQDSVAATETVVTMKDFLHQLSLTVVKADGEVIFEGTAEELDGLAENVLLGTFEKGDSTELTAKLSVPIELGNEYANRVGEVDWVFVAEELNNPAPETGDTTNATPYMGLLVAAGVAIVAIGGFMFYKSKKDSEEANVQVEAQAEAKAEEIAEAPVEAKAEEPGEGQE